MTRVADAAAGEMDPGDDPLAVLHVRHVLRQPPHRAHLPRHHRRPLHMVSVSHGMFTWQASSHGECFTWHVHMADLFTW